MSNDKTLAFLDREAMKTVSTEKYPTRMVQSAIAYDDDFMDTRGIERQAFNKGWLAAHKGPKVQALVDALTEVSDKAKSKTPYVREAFGLIADEVLRAFQSEGE